MSDLLELLSKKPSPLESEQIQEQTSILEKLRLRTEALSLSQWQEGLLRLAPYRLKSSSSLKAGSVETWQIANSYVAQKIQGDHLPQWDDVLKMNALLLGHEHSQVREEKIYIGPIEACPPEQLSFLLEQFQKNILNISAHPDPLTAAALCQYWLISLHPFKDANGRTAVLLTDWILNAHGYLPMTFESKIDAFVATLADRRESATSTNALLKLIRNVQRSYKLVLNEI